MTVITDNGDGNYLLDFNDSDIGTFAIRINACGDGIGDDAGEGQGACPCIGVENDTDIDAVAVSASSAAEYFAATLPAYPNSDSENITGTGQIWYHSAATDQWWFWKEWNGSKWVYKYYYQDDDASAVLTVINCIDDIITDNNDGTYSYEFTDTSPATTTVTWDMSTICFLGIVPGNSVAGVFASGVTFDGTSLCGVRYDEFTNTNGTSLLSHSPNTGSAWHADPDDNNGLFNAKDAILIQDNRAGGGSTSNNGRHVFWDDGVADDFEITFDFELPENSGTSTGVNSESALILYFRAVDGLDLYYAAITPDSMFIRDVNGSFTTPIATTSHTLTKGSEYSCTASVIDDELTVTVGANSVAATLTRNTAVTDHGFQLYSENSGFVSFGWIDNFCVTRV